MHFYDGLTVQSVHSKGKELIKTRSVGQDVINVTETTDG